MKKKIGYKQGIYNPINKTKCKSAVCIYRSGLELKYMRWLDSNKDVISWGSESVVIPYIKPTDGRVHKYFLDFVFTLKDKSGSLKKYIVEVKPAKQCLPPTKHGNKKPNTLLRENVTYATNVSKWNSAKQWANKNGFSFIIITEKDIK